MKSVIKILARYVASAAGVALLLLVLNAVVLAVWTVEAGLKYGTKYTIEQIAQGLSMQEGSFVFSDTAQKQVEAGYSWAMLLSNEGNVLWSQNLPGDVPRSYTVSEVAAFSHWYLNDYPVYVWQHPQGLFVLGSPKNSIWKHGMELPQAIMDNAPSWLIGALIINGIAAVLLAMLFGVRMFRSAKPIAQGIKNMAEKHPVKLQTNGLLGDLAKGINQTSMQLTQQEAALSKRDNARTTWIAGVSHDIRTPLSIAMGYASQLEEDPALSPEERGQAAIIRSQCEKIKALVNDLNLASKLAYDMQPLRLTGLSLAVLVRSAAADFLNSGAGAGYSIEVQIEASEQNDLCIGDEALLRRALSNLLTNSVRHNPNGCAITIAMKPGIGQYTITVSDNGKGFKAETLAALTNPGYPAELQSHGLGLAIVRQIVKAHGGTTRFQNLPQGGCAVDLQLPVQTNL